MSQELNRVYEALQKADEAGNTEDAQQLAAYARQLEQTAKAPAEKPQAEAKEKPIEERLNDIMYPAAGAVAGAGVGGATTAGRIVGGLRNAAKAADPVAMEQARRIAERNAVETWGRTQHRVPGMPSEKPGLYFGEPTYALEKQRAYNEIQKMATDPEYHAKVLAEQKPAVAQYAKRVAQENPTAIQKVGRFLGRAPMGAIAGGLTGLGAGMQASDAVNRYNQGDKLGSAISGIGAAGTGLAMIPHPVTRIGGTAIGLGAEGLNAYIDYLKKNNPFDKLMQQQQQPQQPQPQKMAQGGKVKSLSKAQRAMKHFASGGPVGGLRIWSDTPTPGPHPIGYVGPVMDAPVAPASAPQVTAGPIADLKSIGTAPEPQVTAGPIADLGLGGSTSAPTIMSGMSAQPAPEPMAFEMPQGMPNQNDPLYAQQTEIIPQTEYRGYAPDLEEPGFYNHNYTGPAGEPQVKYGATTQMPQQVNMPLTGAINTNMFNQPAPVAMPLTGAINRNVLRNTNPITNRNPLTMASANAVNPRAPMNPFNPGFAAQRPAVAPTQPRPGMRPQPPRPPVTNQFQPTFNTPIGFRSPIAQRRIAAGLSQLPRKPMFRRFDEGGSV